MDERSSDTEETFGAQTPPSDASNQNSEESEAPHGGGSSGPGSAEKPSGDASETDEPGRPGGAGEQSQATGHPGNAG